MSEMMRMLLQQTHVEPVVIGILVVVSIAALVFVLSSNAK